MSNEKCQPVFKQVTKMSVATASGFECHQEGCEVQTVTYDGSVPLICLGCGGAINPQRLWQDVIRNTTNVETVKA